MGSIDIEVRRGLVVNGVVLSVFSGNKRFHKVKSISKMPK
jgi:hypothetical protein